MTNAPSCVKLVPSVCVPVISVHPVVGSDVFAVGTHSMAYSAFVTPVHDNVIAVVVPLASTEPSAATGVTLVVSQSLPFPSNVSHAWILYQ